MGEIHACTAHNDIRIIIRIRFVTVLYIVQCREGSACARHTMIFTYTVYVGFRQLSTHTCIYVLHSTYCSRLCALM